MQNQRRGNILAAGIYPSHKGLDHGNNDLTCRISGPFCEQGAKLHHQDDALALFQTFDEPVLVCLANNLANIAGCQISEKHPMRTCHLRVIISRGREDLLHISGKLLCVRSVKIIDLLFQLLQILMTDMVFNVVQVKCWSNSSLFRQHDQGLDNHQTDLIRHPKEIWLSANCHSGSYMGHKFFRHIKS